MPVQLPTIANAGTQWRRNSYLSLRTGPRYVASHSLQITRLFFVLLIKAVTDCFRSVRACDYDLRKKMFLWSWINYIRSNSCPSVWFPITIFLWIITTGKQRHTILFVSFLLNLLLFQYWTKGKKHICSMNRFDLSLRFNFRYKPYQTPPKSVNTKSKRRTQTLHKCL